jgi:DNA-3-methyladenine glycosylase
MTGKSPQLLQLKQLLAGDVVQAAAGLVGCIVARRLGSGQLLRAVIVETEAYHQREPGCHAHRGKTKRNSVMFGNPGQLYVYFTYGMWHCANIVCEQPGTAAAVLIRAAAQLPSYDGSPGGDALSLSGPGLFCRGMELTRADNGVNLLSRRGGVWLYRPVSWQPPKLTWTTRIGFSFPDERRWRFCWRDHPAVSKAKPGVLQRKKHRS